MTVTQLRGIQDVPLHRLPVKRERLYRLRSLDFWLAYASALVCSVLIAWGVPRSPSLGGDEGIYTSQADSFLHGQITAYTYTYDHPFFGWAQIAPLAWIAQALHLGGQMSVVNTRVVMLVYAFVSLMLVYGILRRLGCYRVIAVGGTLALGLSPLYEQEARQVFLDNIALTWVLLAFWLALSSKQKQWTYAMAGVCFSIGVLSKETVALMLPALLLIVWTRSYKPIRLMSVAAFVALGTLTVFVYPLFATLRHELFPGTGHVSLWGDGVMYQLANRKGSGTLWSPGSTRYNLFHTWLNTDHWILLVGAGAALLCLGSRRFRPIGLAWLLWVLPLLKPGGYLPAMYVIAGLPFAAMAIAGCGDMLTRFVLSRSWFDRSVRWGALALCWAMVGALLVWLVPSNTAKPDTHAIAPQEQALAYLTPLLRSGDNILTDDAFWLDLVRAGHGSVANPWKGAISYYQFDLDPISSQANLPDGWQDISYVLSTAEMRSNVGYLKLTNVGLTLANSTLLVSFGTGASEVDVLAVQSTPYNDMGDRS